MAYIFGVEPGFSISSKAGRKKERFFIPFDPKGDWSLKRSRLNETQEKEGVVNMEVTDHLTLSLSFPNDEAARDVVDPHQSPASP